MSKNIITYSTDAWCNATTYVIYYGGTTHIIAASYNIIWHTNITVYNNFIHWFICPFKEILSTDQCDNYLNHRIWAWHLPERNYVLRMVLTTEEISALVRRVLLNFSTSSHDSQQWMVVTCGYLGVEIAKLSTLSTKYVIHGIVF